MSFDTIHHGIESESYLRHFGFTVTVQRESRKRTDYKVELIAENPTEGIKMIVDMFMGWHGPSVRSLEKTSGTKQAREADMIKIELDYVKRVDVGKRILNWQKSPEQKEG